MRRAPITEYALYEVNGRPYLTEANTNRLTVPQTTPIRVQNTPFESVTVTERTFERGDVLFEGVGFVVFRYMERRPAQEERQGISGRVMGWPVAGVELDEDDNVNTINAGSYTVNNDNIHSTLANLQQLANEQARNYQQMSYGERVYFDLPQVVYGNTFGRGGRRGVVNEEMNRRDITKLMACELNEEERKALK